MHMEARDQCWVSFSITIHFVFETESLPGSRAYQLDRLANQLPLGILLFLPSSAHFTIKLGFFVGAEGLML